MPDHRHRPVTFADLHGDVAAGQTPDRQLITDFLAAAMAGCRTCRGRHLTRLVKDVPTVVRLVQHVCMIASMRFGHVPGLFCDPDGPGPASAEFRRLVRTGAVGDLDTPDPDDLPADERTRRGRAGAAAQVAAVHVMGVEARRQVCLSAAELIVGYLVWHTNPVTGKAVVRPAAG